MLIMKKLKIRMALVQYDSVTTFEMTVNCGNCVIVAGGGGGGGGGGDSCAGLRWGTKF